MNSYPSEQEAKGERVEVNAHTSHESRVVDLLDSTIHNDIRSSIISDRLWDSAPPRLTQSREKRRAPPSQNNQLPRRS